MKNRVLVSYATRAGSTREVAEYIAKVLREAGEVVDVGEAQEVRDVRPYTHVILGTGIRAGSLFPEVVQFARRFRSYLQNIETSYFVVCLTMKEDTPENRQTVEGYLKPLVEIKTPVSTGLFAGVVAYDKLGFVIRFMLQRLAKNDPNIAEGDYRDWEAIRAWALSLVPEMA